MKWAKESPEEYKETSNIFLLSAFLTSILSGKIAPVDTGDGWGTNLNNLNVIFPGWSKEVLKVINSYLEELSLPGDLEKKIGKIVHYDSIVGKINSYFVQRYGFEKDTIVIAGTGDNPATLLGCGGEIVISLGSSFTVNGIMRKLIPSLNGEYNIFGYTKRKAMGLSCFTNGAKLHDYFLRKYLSLSEENPITKFHWEKYQEKVGDRLLSKDEPLMLPYLFNESVPLCKKGIVRDGFSEDDAEKNIRALHISQPLSLRLHSSHLNKVKSICIVGGAAKNLFLRQMITDVFNVESFSIKNSEFAAPIGCAISGAKVFMDISYKKAINWFMKKDAESYLKPISKNQSVIKYLLKRYEELEKKHLEKNK